MARTGEGGGESEKRAQQGSPAAPPVSRARMLQDAGVGAGGGDPHNTPESDGSDAMAAHGLHDRQRGADPAARRECESGPDDNKSRDSADTRLWTRLLAAAAPAFASLNRTRVEVMCVAGTLGDRTSRRGCSCQGRRVALVAFLCGVVTCYIGLLRATSLVSSRSGGDYQTSRHAQVALATCHELLVRDPQPCGFRLPNEPAQPGATYCVRTRHNQDAIVFANVESVDGVGEGVPRQERLQICAGVPRTRVRHSRVVIHIGLGTVSIAGDVGKCMQVLFDDTCADDPSTTDK